MTNVISITRELETYASILWFNDENRNVLAREIGISVKPKKCIVSSPNQKQLSITFNYNNYKIYVEWSTTIILPMDYIKGINEDDVFIINTNPSIVEIIDNETGMHVPISEVKDNNGDNVFLDFNLKLKCIARQSSNGHEGSFEDVYKETRKKSAK